MFKSVLFLLFFLPLVASSQNLTKERIRKVSKSKKSIFLNRGIFHNGLVKNSSRLKSIRENYSSSKGYERIVFDFETKQIPRIYGYINSKERKLYIDFFKTKLNPRFKKKIGSKYIKDIKILRSLNDILSIEVIFKKSIRVDLFYLENPGRLVVDSRI